ncbi:MAG TPA: hypothetical protein VF133_02710 [Terriglobales bacterium]
MRPQKTAKIQILSGWKEIASYLRKGVRTIQRYEREMGLPIHRPAGKSSGAVVATKTELDEWVTSPRGPLDSMAKRRTLESRTNKLRANFLQIDCEIALTFASVALGTTDQEKRRRTSQTARKAYDTIMRLRKDIALSDAEAGKLEANLQRLKSELRSLGQRF